jgi:hypothetical protein
MYNEDDIDEIDHVNEFDYSNYNYLEEDVNDVEDDSLEEVFDNEDDELYYYNL